MDGPPAIVGGSSVRVTASVEAVVIYIATVGLTCILVGYNVMLFEGSEVGVLACACSCLLIMQKTEVTFSFVFLLMTPTRSCPERSVKLSLEGSTIVA